jgi:hypothetical protein
MFDYVAALWLGRTRSTLLQSICRQCPDAGTTPGLLYWSTAAGASCACNWAPVSTMASVEDGSEPGSWPVLALRSERNVGLGSIEAGLSVNVR